MSLYTGEQLTELLRKGLSAEQFGKIMVVQLQRPKGLLAVIRREHAYCLENEHSMPALVSVLGAYSAHTGKMKFQTTLRKFEWWRRCGYALGVRRLGVLGKWARPVVGENDIKGGLDQAGMVFEVVRGLEL